VRGRVVIVDDVVSAGTSVRESIAMITGAGATAVGVAIALDRQEKSAENGVDQPWSAVQYITAQLGLRVVSIASLADLLQYLQASSDATLAECRQAVSAYRNRYGVEPMLSATHPSP
jgi:orotate phosphoribosyltransferase